MGMFGFDEQFAMFDITPVENQFILEYMPGARGDFVKVYLYGLMQCYHPQEEMSVEQMAHELNMSEEEILTAYRHWERKGLVKRIADHPPVYRYINVKQQFFMRDAAPVDPAYEDFGEALYAAFGNDRRLHGKEISMAYEWVEDMGLPPEVVLMLIQHMISIRGKNFSFKAAQKLAVTLADEKVSSIEDAEMILSRNKAVWDGSKRILRRFGKRRDPSEDEMALYLKWIRDFGFSADAIEAACAETTKGDPSFAYLDGILRGMKRRQGNKPLTSGKAVEEARQREIDRSEPLKALLHTMNIRGVSVNEGTLAAYDVMRAMYSDEIILMAGRECALQGGKLDDVTDLLMSWQEQGLRTVQDIQQYTTRHNREDNLMMQLNTIWGRTDKPGKSERTLMTKWQDELKLSQEMILFCAEFATKARTPMAYLDAILTKGVEQGITTPEQAAQAHAARQAQQGKMPQGTAPAQRPRKTVGEQQYEQRPYENTAAFPDWIQSVMKDKEMNNDA